MMMMMMMMIDKVFHVEQYKRSVQHLCNQLAHVDLSSAVWTNEHQGQGWWWECGGGVCW